MTLIACFFLPLPTADQNENYTAPKIVTIDEDKSQTINDKDHYAGILITREGLKSYLSEVFTYNGIEDYIPLAEKIILCESGWNIQASNGISFGILQFTPPTWADFGEGDIWNPHTQIRTMAKMIRLGLIGRWDCYQIVNNPVKK